MVVLTTRSRVRSDAFTDHWTINLGGSVFGGDLETYTFYEETHDRVNRKVDGRYKPSPMIHVSHRASLRVPQSGTIYTGEPYYFTDDQKFDVSPSDVNNLLPVVPDSLWEDLCLECFNEFATQIPTEVSIANFTWELRELGQLIPKFMDSLSKSIAGGYLTYSFGWKPFVSDCVALANLFTTVNAKIQHLINTWGKRTRLGFYRKDVINDVILIPQWIPVGGPDHLLALVGHRAEFRGTGRLFHQLKGLKTMYGDIRAFISALGLNNPVKAFWDAIPFSFVAGWFTRVGRHLTTLAINPYKGEWNVHDLSFSLTERIVLFGQVGGAPGSSIPYGTDAGRVEVKRYTRLDGFPIGVNSFNLFDLNPSQQTLLGALIVGHTKH